MSVAVLTATLNPALLPAADKNGVSPSAISLPKGPGSIEGLGESFQPVLSSGTAKYEVGVEVPSGPAGHVPKLKLGYEGGGGNGALGFGWTLSLQLVQRRTDRGIPTYGENLGFSREDVFINESKEELVPQTNGYYFCRNEGAFTRYRSVGNYWEATLPEGTRLEFGRSAAARIEDPVTGHVCCWLLESGIDTHTNTILYSYATFPGIQNTNQKYLASIRYGPGARPWENFHFVVFEYEDRPDWLEDCRSGFVLRTGKRLKRVIVGTQGPTLPGHQQGDFSGDGITDNLDRIYELQYVPYAGTNSHWSLLGSVRLVGADGSSALPPASFGYAICDPADTLSATDKEIGGVNEPPMVMDNELAELADLNGDGLPDVLRTGGAAHQAFLNLGEALDQGQRVIRWAAPAEMDSLSGDAFNFSLDQTATHLADMDGDGVSDLVHKTAAESVFYFLNQNRLGWGERTPMAAGDYPPPAPFGTPDVRVADVDFDKRMDLIRGDGIQYQIWFNLGNQQYSERVTVLPDTVFDFSLPAVQIADLNGDRVPDVARIRPATVEVTAGLGYGRFASLVTVLIPDGPLDDAQVQKAKLSDINGDGLADLVLERVEPGTLWYWLNLGNYTFGPRKVITGMPTGIGQNAVIRWADVNGNGTTDLVYADGASTPRIRTVDIGELMGCVGAPNTLLAISNGIGRVTLIGYRPSTRYALDDAAAGRPWPDPVPFPLTVVSAVTNLDSLGHAYATVYHYHDGYYDPGEKQFRGFGHVEQVELGDSSAPALVSHLYFDTGRNFESLKGKLLRQTAGLEDGRVFWDESTTWTVPPRTLMTGINGTNVTFAHPISRVKVVKELGQGVERRLESEFEFDAYGNQILEADYGMVEAGDRSAYDDERITRYEFALNLERWILRSPCRIETRDEQGVVAARVEDYYDDESFSGANYGEVQLGNLTLRRKWINPADPQAFIAAQRAKYDPYGNAILNLDPLAGAPGGVIDVAQGHYREVAMDSRFHSDPVRETVFLGGARPPLVAEAEHDPGFGRLTRARDYNGHETKYGYDPFARLGWVVKPGDTEAYPSSEFTYVLAQQVAPGRIVNYTESRQLDKPPVAPGARRDHYFISRRFTDGLGRHLMTKEEADSDPESGQPRVVVSGATLFNARQKPAVTLNPFFSAIPGQSTDQLLEFEDISDPAWHGNFHYRGQLVSLDLAAAHKTSLSYDAVLRTTQTTNPDGSFTRAVFEPLLTRDYDENDCAAGSPYFDTPKVLYRDGLQRNIRTDEVVRLTDSGEMAGDLRTWTTRFAYDLNDCLVRITDSQNNTKEMAYDGLKRLVWMNDPDRGVGSYVYDDASNLVEARDAKNQRITYTYDGTNRLLTEDYHDEGEAFSYGFVYDPARPVSSSNRPDVAYFYDSPVTNLDLGNGMLGTAENTRGMLAYVWDLSGEEHRSYSARLLEAYTVKRIVDPVDGTLVSYQSRQEYDSLDRLTRLTYPDNDTIDYDYNDRKLLRGISGEASGAILSVADYAPSQQIRESKSGNGISTRYSYDECRRLHSLFTAPDASSNQPLVAFDYSYDGASNLKSIQDQRPATLIPAGSPRRNSQRFEYDDLYRLSSVRFGFGPPGDTSANDGEIQYRHDRIGNRVRQTSNIDHTRDGQSLTDLGTLSYGGTEGSWGRLGRNSAEPGAHALSTITAPTNAVTTRFGYDANGNVTNKSGSACTWDFKDRLVSAEDATTQAEYRYDYRHRRITRLVTPKAQAATNTPPLVATAAEITFYVSPSFEVRPPDQPVKFVWNGPNRVARVSGSLSHNLRVQRLRLAKGWNLVALAVSASNLWAQLAPPPSPERPPPIVQAAYSWRPPDQSFGVLAAGENAVAGTVLWLSCSAAGSVSVTGAYSDPDALSVPAGPGFLSCPGFEPLTLPEMLTGDLTGWAFDAWNQAWQAKLPAPLAMSQLPPKLAPGQALFLQPDGPVSVVAPDLALRFQYYHQDHLGSSSVITDVAGQLVEETAYYPFGEARHHVQPRQVSEPYRFTQKELDAESGLYCFEARFLSGVIGRFITPDPAYADLSQMEPERLQAVLGNPQDLNLYSYVRNNPLIFRDPTGLGLELVTEPPKVQVTVISGHGFTARPEDVDMSKANEGKIRVRKPRDPGYTVVPEGTTLVMYSRHGQSLEDNLGNAIETQQVDKDQWRVEYHAGDKVPNYVLAPPVGLNVVRKEGVNLVTVDRPTSLSEMLKPGMGPVHYAACRSGAGTWKTGAVIDIREYRRLGLKGGEGGSAVGMDMRSYPLWSRH
ncbi:MAG TPA: toxin TcdB middle/N-terminal domain-containing protein [Verrucomicrobiae bacterium]